MAQIKAKKKESTKREEFKLLRIPEPLLPQFGLAGMKGSLLKYNENIRTSKDIRFSANGRLKIPVFSADPAICEVGEVAVIGTKHKTCTAANVWTITGTQT